MLKHSFTMFDWELVTVSSCSRNSPISISSVIVFMCAKPTRINILQGYCWCMLLSPSPLCCTDHSPLLKAGCGDDGCWKQIHRKLAMGDPANRANRANDRITGQFQIIFVRYRNLLNQGHVVTCVKTFRGCDHTFAAASLIAPVSHYVVTWCKTTTANNI